MIAQIYFALISILAAGGGGGGLLSVDQGLAFWTTLTFLLLLFLLKKFAWGPILTALKQRELSIKESLEQAEKAKEEAKKILSQNEANLAKAEEESKKIIEQSRMYAENLKQQILNESKAQAKKMIDDATAEIERKKLSALDELKNQIAQIAVDAASKIIKENLDSQKNKELVEDLIKQISKN
jgi:F-type H+-transporting ATPase subunit b